MPAEWEPHAATWLAWPHFEGDWPGKSEPIPWVYAEVVRNLAQHERVELIVNDTSSESKARKFLDRANALSANRVGMRDSGCIFLMGQKPGFARSDSGEPAVSLSKGRLSPHKALDGEVLALKFRFNAWAKYSNWRHDEKVGSLMAKGARTREIRPLSGERRIVLEGGSIDVNGCGTLLTTEECLLSNVQERNPGMTRVQYEKAFADYLGAPNVIWLGRGIFGDDTHGHVDDLTRFVATDTLVTMVEPGAKDVNHCPRSERKTTHHCRNSHARPGCVRGTKAAGQLCQLLHRQRSCPGSRFQRSQ